MFSDISTARPVEILLVEDNPGDVELTRLALRDGKVRNVLHVVTDGEEAMQFLRRTGTHSDAPRPDLVLLDLNLPKKDGHEVLAEIKEDADLCNIPVIVLTTSEAEKDVLSAYEQRANAYIIKPVDLDQFFQVVRSIEGFWLTVVRLPPVPSQ
jgi:chemotaxis family two-component system response regulator Rcp1